VRTVSVGGYWVIRSYTAGAVGEKTKFWVQGARPGRSSRREKTELRKQEQNEYSAVKRLARILNANFGPGDLLLGLDYSEDAVARLREYAESQGADMERAEEAERAEYLRRAAERELRLVLRRVKRELEKTGVELRYVAVTSDMDGDTGEAVRLHHHLIVPAQARAAFLKRWGLGGVSWSPLSAQPDYLPVAEYLLRQVRRAPDGKKYISSRNLIRPLPRDRVALTDAELRVPRGGKLLQRSEYRPGKPQYIRYVLPETRRKGPPGWDETA